MGIKEILDGLSVVPQLTVLDLRSLCMCLNQLTFNGFLMFKNLKLISDFTATTTLALRVLLQLHRGCSMSVVFRGSSCGMLFCLCSIISSQSLPGFHTASIHSCLPRSCCMVNLNCPRYDCVGHSHYQIAKYALKCLHRGSEWQAGGAAVLAEGFIHIQSLKTLVLRSVC